jgi:arginyl-tRNA synthetase
VYLTLLHRLRTTLAKHLLKTYGVEIAVVLERPPKLEMGEAASPVCFELAKRMKKAPGAIAQEIVVALPKIVGIARVQVAGGGYLNAFFDRVAFWGELAGGAAEKTPAALPASGQADGGGYTSNAKRVIVEHTSINPNKAAHIGHLRNAVLGDTMVRLLRHTGNDVLIQNYIDNTGVQVADVVIAFAQMEKKSVAEVRKLASEPRFDYLCWDLYAKATQFFAEDKARAGQLRGETLKAIEAGEGATAGMAGVIADAIVSCHLRTMARLDIYYELLARESEILHLHFWEAAFEKLKASGAIVYVSSGKNAGCWVMPWKQGAKERKEAKEVRETSTDEQTASEEDQAKIIVRSNGTVTYVGKDIAYQLWKFGLLGKDFHYRKWPDAPGGKTVWATTAGANEPGAPHFGGVAVVYNVIDARQAYLQDVVKEGVRTLGYPKEAENSIHFDYEIVALTPRCAAEMGYEVEIDESKKPYVEVSGRKGLGVKADDLITKMFEAAQERVRQKQSDMSDVMLSQTAAALAIGALRFFLLKFTRNTIIAFDFEDALKAEGETGPYCQYAVVRARSIWRKGAERDPRLGSERGIREIAASLRLQNSEFAKGFLASEDAKDIWELILLAGSLDYAVDAAIGSQEPAFVTKYAFQLAQAFNNFYHRHHILSEEDAQKRAFLLALTEMVEEQLVRALGLLGIETPEKM